MIGVCNGRWVSEPVVHGLRCQRSPICELPESISRCFTGVSSTSEAIFYTQNTSKEPSAAGGDEKCSSGAAVDDFVVGGLQGEVQGEVATRRGSDAELRKGDATKDQDGLN